MQSDELLREGLRRLLKGTPERPAGTPARREEVARRAGCSPDNLYQAATGILLPSGARRSVGRDTRLKLDAAYPGWLDGLEETAAGAQDDSTGIEPSIREALHAIRNRLLQARGDVSEAIGDALRLMAQVPDSDRAFDEALKLLSEIPSR